ncbi:Acetylornithine aminotransferase, mitochondrial [Komagataella phaffii CBS 7435]|uniref:Acetylornithine aminotransferase, mitochondrial n=1 Tax=Komagataella phaffii (strain ATCC 76273 / CBS 7435 / CECT 11047 / NRRL Y-11430 / Wegner 21-1) TaxID=981350 RepID=F2QYL6_KOMPC|nr:GQ67_05020T0 [Komagataella phaffii]AOA69672.1 GQ68_05001T0 [Komagataella phaffii GS115]CAH2450694.1 Acetylornithine aminotransferase, mitochondrial [Komagataella phaffii CBS 7435]CCA40494.1 Acetylornithine aminotransferase, mitochondrial [Komagataella phaffii CBS 7435]
MKCSLRLTTLSVAKSTRMAQRSVVCKYSTQPNKQEEFVKERENYTVTTYSRPNLVFEKGQGSYLWDIEGGKYIDFTAGIAVTALGHANPKIAEILYDQAKKVIHTSNLYHNLWTSELSKQLVEKTKESGGMKDASRVFLGNSGTEANEAALKFARKYGKSIAEDKIEFITFETSFHGRSMGALSVTPNKKYQAPFAPLIPGVKVAKPNDIHSVEKLISDKTCGVILEPIQGEGGVRPMEAKFLAKVRQLCDEHNALLIYDEIQCGLGRTGNLWAHCKLGEETHPDILTMAKALGNGYPIGATMITEKVESVLKVGDHGTTYGGNPLGARVGSYVLQQVSDKDFLSKVEQKSEIFKVKLSELQEKFPDLITDVRGDGLLLGIEFNIDPAPICAIAREKGLLIITAGGNVIRFVPALNIESKVIYEGLAILEEAVKEFAENQ